MIPDGLTLTALRSGPSGALCPVDARTGRGRCRERSSRRQLFGRPAARLVQGRLPVVRNRRARIKTRRAT